MNAIDKKLQRLKELGKQRQEKCYAGYHSIAEFHNKQYESDFVSPYSKSACNTNSDILVLLQDWLGHDKISGPFIPDAAKLGHLSTLPTNVNLKRLFKKIFGLELQNIFVTNVFPFIKKGKMNAPISKSDFFKAFKEFGYPQIEIVKPKLVVCCGRDTYNASLNHFNIPIKKTEPVGSHFERNGILFYKQAHPGGQGVAQAGGFNKVEVDWIKMKTDYEQFKNCF